MAAVKCRCGGGKAHHAVRGDRCWCDACLKKPEDDRCGTWLPAEPSVDANRRYVGHNHPRTAQAMADNSLPRVGSLRRQVYDWIAKKGGLTDDDLEYVTGRSHQSVSAARNTLMNDGLIKDSGETRLNRHQNEAIVWVVTPR